MTIIEEFFDSRTLASRASARYVAAAIRQRLEESPKAALIVSGGSTPAECFRILADTDLKWDRVQILPSDERCVHANHDASNEGMIRRLLVTNCAAEANLVTMYNEELLPEDQCSFFEEKLESISQPFAISLLGMGADGHFASLFPDSDEIDEGLNPNSDRDCMLVRTSACSHPRISLTMATLLDSTEILLLFFGAAKREIYEQAKHHDSAYPLSRLLHQQRTPVRTIWAP
jgi:6-phosphogluconolactonase